MASEVGVLPVDPGIVKEKGRLQPGRMFLVDFEQGRMIPDEELKDGLAAPTSVRASGSTKQRDRAAAICRPNGESHGFDPETLLPRMQAFGYTQRDDAVHAAAAGQREARSGRLDGQRLGAGGAVSDQPRMLYDYFKQLFAQVTNPPIDSIREEVIMSLECYIGPEANLLETTEEQRPPAAAAASDSDERRSWRRSSTSTIAAGRRSTIDITFAARIGRSRPARALDRICHEAEQAIDDGYQLVVLSDRAISRRARADQLAARHAARCIITWFASTKRTRIGIILETGEAREVHHHCLLVGYGADAINPYLAFEALWQAQRDGTAGRAARDSDDEVVYAYRKAVAKGMLKVMAKMGISTLQSYKGAQIFEAVGLERRRDRTLLRRHRQPRSRASASTCSPKKRCAGTRSAIPTATPSSAAGAAELRRVPLAGRRRDGTCGIRRRSPTCRSPPATNSADAYWRFSKHTNEEATRNCTLRGLLKFKTGVNDGRFRSTKSSRRRKSSSGSAPAR